MIPTSIVINHHTLIRQPASTKSFPHTHSNQNRNAAIYSMHVSSSLQQKQILPQDALQSQSVSITEALSIHSSGVSHVSAAQESPVRAKSTTTLVTRHSSFPDLPPLENCSIKSCSYLLKSMLSSTLLRLCSILPGVLRDVQHSMCRDAHLSTSFVNLPWRREVLHCDSNLGIHFMQHQLPSPALPVLLLCWEQLHQRERTIQKYLKWKEKRHLRP